MYISFIKGEKRYICEGFQHNYLSSVRFFAERFKFMLGFIIPQRKINLFIERIDERFEEFYSHALANASSAL